ncbi:MAG: cyclohexa-1,5-dienecarbonyl-CoA hydratase [Xanthobacteraceae bacterium]|nr:MAG: cyclohexa-1,5-dienecarbonyl-CoA hydratase [Xanthobacteraceae bacterium]
MTTSPLESWLDRDGKVLRLRLNRPKANIVDAAMIAALDAALAAHAGKSDLAAVVLDAAGPHFSFGASVEEHFPDQMAKMLASLHGLLKRMLNYPCPILVAVQGQCLGGGLEVALAGSLIFASKDAKLGQPEIKLGVFAPAASCLLPERTRQAVADDLLFSGRTIAADEALQLGVVDRVTDDPSAAALAYYDEHLAAHSVCALRYAVKAARTAMVRRVEARLDEVEKQCGVDLVKTHDCLEGLTAFQEKRAPRWTNN